MIQYHGRVVTTAEFFHEVFVHLATVCTFLCATVGAMFMASAILWFPLFALFVVTFLLPAMCIIAESLYHNWMRVGHRKFRSWRSRFDVEALEYRIAELEEEVMELRSMIEGCI